tara:strand:- start:5400 stop:5930 length:531 start_codon:yes stop_codon:yes gene_type:complete
MSANDDKPSNKKVGYKRPPEHTQFKPGQSGNPRGRPKKSSDEGTHPMDKALAKKVRMPDGTSRSKQDILCEVMTNDAIKGNAAAQRLVNQRINQSHLQKTALAAAKSNQHNFENRGGVMLVPGIMDIDEWQRQALAQQEELTRLCEEDHAKTAEANREIQNPGLPKAKSPDNEDKK